MSGLTQPYRLLTLSVLHQAVKDVRRSNRHVNEAYQFLRSDWCAHLAGVMGIEEDLTDLVKDLSENHGKGATGAFSTAEGQVSTTER